jgi:hypothetical protein
MKKIAILSLCVLLCAPTFVNASAKPEFATDTQKTAREKGKRLSVFADFERLGMNKEEFLGEFGLPTFKKIARDAKGDELETLYYIEDLTTSTNVFTGPKEITIVTVVTFSGGVLTELESAIANLAGMIDPREIASDIKYIKSEVD